MRIPSGKTDQTIFFVAVDSTDFVTRETGLSSFTVYRSRNGAAAVAYTTPTVTEVDNTNMPGVYALLVDEDTTVAAGSDSEEYCVHITKTGMAPVTRTIELYRRDTTSGRSLDVSAGGEAGIDWANIGAPTTTVNLSGTTVKTATDVAAQTDKLTFDVGNHVVADTRKLGTNATAATNLRSGAVALVVSTCAVGSSTTSIVTNLTESTDDHYNGRVITFTDGALAGQATNITDYNGTSKTLTVTALTEAPADTDAFVIS